MASEDTREPPYDRSLDEQLRCVGNYATGSGFFDAAAVIASVRAGAVSPSPVDAGEIPDFRKLLNEKNKRPMDGAVWMVRCSNQGLVECGHDEHEFTVARGSALENARRERDHAEGLLGWAASLLKARAAAPPVGVDEGQSVLLASVDEGRVELTQHYHGEEGERIEHMEMWLDEHEELIRSRPSSAAPGVTEAVKLLHELTDHEDKPCSLDHHGYCQEHGWFDESECAIARTRSFLAALVVSPAPPADELREARETLALIDALGRDGLETAQELALRARSRLRVSPAPTEGPDDA